MEDHIPTSPTGLNQQYSLQEHESYLYDESKLTASSVKVILFPKTTMEISNIFSSKRDDKQLITVSGARTGLVGGAVPIVEAGEEAQTLLSLEKMKQISGIEERNGNKYLRVESGVRLLEVNEYLREHEPSLFFPVDPTERSASFGGMISTNAGGARSFRYGNIRSWIEEITVVLVSGEILKIPRGEKTLTSLPCLEKMEDILELNKPDIKRAIGPDLKKDMDLIDLFIGAEGIYGVVTEAVIRLEKIPQNIVGFLQFFKSESIALDCVNKLRSNYRTNIMSIEYFDELAINFALKSKKPLGDKISHILEDDAKSGIFFELDLDSYAGNLDQFFEAYMDILEDLGADAEHCVMANDFTELEDIKAFRHAVPEQILACITERKKAHPNLRKVATDMAVPDSCLHEVIKLYREQFSSRELEFTIFGHIGSNHLHVNILPRDESDISNAIISYREIAREVVRMGGVVSAEHGIGRLKKEFFIEQFSEAQINQLKKIKLALDPELKLNIGVLFDIERI